MSFSGYLYELSIVTNKYTNILICCNFLSNSISDEIESYVTKLNLTRLWCGKTIIETTLVTVLIFGKKKVKYIYIFFFSHHQLATFNFFFECEMAALIYHLLPFTTTATHHHHHHHWWRNLQFYLIILYLLIFTS